MKYFPQEESSGDEYASLTTAQRKALDRKFSRNFKAYHKQLDKLKRRISPQAWKFFALGLATRDFMMHVSSPFPRVMT
jgi:hypothetical protein